MIDKVFVQKLLRTIIIALLSFIFVLPLLWMISSSLKPNAHVFDYPIKWIPETFHFQNYTDVWQSTSMPFALVYWNSIKIAIVTIVGKLLVSSLAAYAFSKMHFPFSKVIFMLFLGSMMIPGQVTILPRFVLFKELGLYNTHAALIIPGMLGVSAIFLLKQFYDAVPNDLTESAFIDGAGHLRIWYQIVVPLTKAPMASLAVLSLVSTWNDYFDPLIFLVNKRKYTLSLAIRHYAGDVNVNLGLAASVCAILPIFILFTFCQRYFIQSIVSSGIKG